MSERKFNVGVVLSGGGARGFAHLGFLKALEEAGFKPDIISGTSAGAIVGVLYADGYSPNEILNLLHTGSRLDFMRPALPREGLLQISGITKILKNSLRAKKFNELKTPLFVCATDLNNGKPVYFSEGNLVEPVIASASIPVIFQPVVIDDISYVDGGVLDNFPVQPLENKCRILMGSFVNPAGHSEKITGLLNIAVRSFMLSMSKEIIEKSKKFDLYVSPGQLGNYKILDPEKAEELFDVGYVAAKEKLKNFDAGKL